METIHAFLDTILLFAFRLPGASVPGFFIGLFWAALVATVLGELCMAGAYFANRKHFAAMRKDMVTNTNLSLQALRVKDKESYTACNSLANEAFGQSFFSGIALFASSVWPAFFVLSWLDYRFSGVVFELGLPGPLAQVGPPFFFVPLYILVRIGFAFAKPYLPVFGAIKRAVARNEACGEDLMTYSDVFPEINELHKKQSKQSS